MQGIGAMSYGVCLITAGLPLPSPLADWLARCGITLWTPASSEAADGSVYKRAMCIFIDMPGASGLKFLDLMRRHGITTPVIIVADRGQYSADKLRRAGVLDVLVRPIDARDVLRWIESACIRQKLLDRLQQEMASHFPKFPQAEAA
jgi:FixJ family two-component response regulator